MAQFKLAGLAFVAFGVLTVSASTLQAQDPDGFTDAYTSCMDMSGGVTVEMLNCIADETAVQDRLLNQNYKALQSTLTDDRRAQLKEAQRAWIAYRDLNCAFYEDPDGGTMATISAASCLLQMTADRAAELAMFAQ